MSLKNLSGRLRSLKGWLTQTIDGCKNLVAMPQSVMNASVLKSRIEKSISELDMRLEKIFECLRDMQELELDQDYDENRKERERAYATCREESAARHQECLNQMLEALVTLATLAEPDSSSQPGNVTFLTDGLEDRFKVQDSLKPPLLNKDSSPTEFDSWKKAFRAFYSASRLEKLDIISQQAFFRQFISPELMSVLEAKIGTTTSIFDDANAPGTDSCLGLLNTEMLLRYPLVARRFKFFNLVQTRKETFIEFLAKVKSHSTLANLETLGIEGMIIYKAIIGINDDYGDLREKILQLSELNMCELERVARSYESAQSAIREIGAGAGVSAGAGVDAGQSTVCRIRTQFRQKLTHDRQDNTRVIGNTPRERIELLRKKKYCLRCGRHPYDRHQKCWAASAQCYICQDIGHLSYLCDRDQNENQSDENSDASESEDGYDEGNQGAQTRAVFTA